MDFSIIRAGQTEGRFYAVARWQVEGEWRSLQLWTDDDGIHWWWVDWWLAGGISANGIIGAYQAVGAVDLNASLVNLNSVGTNNLTVAGSPTLNNNFGWTLNDGSTDHLSLSIPPSELLAIAFNIGNGLAAETYSDIGIKDATLGEGLNLRTYSSAGAFYNADVMDVPMNGISGLNLDSVIIGLRDDNNAFHINGNGQSVQAGASMPTNTIPEVVIGGVRYEDGTISHPLHPGNIGLAAFYRVKLTQQQITDLYAHIVKLRELYNA